MKYKIYTLAFTVFVILKCFSQPSNSFYYYKNQPVALTFSNKEMFVKFLPNLSNSQKASLINQAQVDLIDGDLNNIADVVRLRSRTLQRLVWVYPCPIAPILIDKLHLSKEDLKGAIFQKPPPCIGCPPPPPCSTPPYQILQPYDNFYDALFFFGEQNDIRSASIAIIKNNSNVGTCEDFFIKIKPNFNIGDFTNLLNYFSLVATDVSSDFGNLVYKISETRGGSRFCIERANIFYQTGKLIFSVPNFYEFNPKLTSDPLWNNQWNLLNTGQNGTIGTDVRAEPAWTITRGNGINVAVIDDGVQLNHPDLANNMLPGFDATLQTGGTNGAPGTLGESHGTSCAGIIAAVANNNIGISGIAPLSRIIPIRAFSTVSTTTDIVNTVWLARALNWARVNGADIISCSWENKLQSDLLEQSIIDATTFGRFGRGCIVVFAAGNTETNSLSYPANMQEVIAVGSLTMCNTRKSPNSCDGVDSWGSSYGNDLDLVAPGVNIATLTNNNGTTTTFGGTSSACPLVSGIAALVLSINNNLTLDEVKRILYYSCNKVGPYCYNWNSNHPLGGWNEQMGYGRINAFNAVQLAQNATTYSNQAYNIPKQNYSLVNDNYMQFIIINSACAYISSATYAVKRYEVTTNINFPYTPNPLIICSSNGWSAANPNDGKQYATAINITNTSATLKCWVYEGYTATNQYIGWIPRPPAEVSFNYSVIGASGNIGFQQSKGKKIDSLEKSIKIDYEFDKIGVINDNLIEVITKKDDFKFYPNPASEFIYVNNSFLEIKKIDVLGTQGNLIKSVQTSKKNTGIIAIEISDLSVGLYFLKVYQGNKTIIKKFIKK
jgi:subtilisin family serine protease